MGIKKVGVAALLAVAVTFGIGRTVNTVSEAPLVIPPKLEASSLLKVKKPKIEPKVKPIKKLVIKPVNKPIISINRITNKVTVIKPVKKLVKKPVKKLVKKVIVKKKVKPVVRVVRKPIVKRVYKPVAKPVQTYYRKTARGMEISKYEYDLLVRIAHAEAGGDGMASQIGVVNVVLNRVRFGGYFPTNIAGVIYQKGQFSPVADGRINEPVEAENYRAVDRVLNGENNIGNCQFFWADYVDKSNFLWSKPVLYKYGKTVFAN